MENLPAAEPVGVIEGDLNCRKCGYNLRGLDAAGRCPECGTAVGYSVRGDLLRFSDPDWLATLRRGIVLILIAIVILVIVAIGNAMLQSQRVAGAAVLAAIATVIAQAVWCAGLWFLTSSDPSGLGEQDYGGMRRFTRIAMLLGLGRTLVVGILQFAELPTAVAVGIGIVSGVIGLIGLAGVCAQLVYLSRLAERLPDAALAGRAKSLAWWIGISYGVVLADGALMLAFGLTGGRTHAPGAMAAGCTAAIAGLILLVAGIGYLLLLDRFRRRLREEETIARQTWAAAPA